MSRAVISRNIAPPLDPPKRKPHIMPGAEVPAIPDKDRPLDQVCRDHAIQTWGELRDVAVLDSYKATEILAAALERFLLSVRDDTNVFKKRISELEKAGSYAMGKMREATSRPPQGVAESDNRRRCKVCNKPFTSHATDCPVGKAIVKAEEVGFQFGTEADR